MTKKYLVYYLLLYVVCACSSDENKIENETEKPIDETGIILNIDEEQVVTTSDEITVSLSEEIETSSLKISLDNSLVREFLSPPYTFSIEAEKYADGDHSLVINITTIHGAMAARSFPIKIDNTGPRLTINDIAKNEILCTEMIFSPEISDPVSGVHSLEIFFEDTSIAKVEDSKEFSFTFNPESLPIGEGNLKFIAKDKVGNITADSVDISIAKKIIEINFPDDFTRLGTDKVHVILSDADGNFIENQTHSDKAETIMFCTQEEEFTVNTEFILTFVEEFENSIFNFHVYNDLSQSKLGNEITFKPRSRKLIPAFVRLEVPFLEEGYFIRASGMSGGYSMVYINNLLSGHYTTSYSGGPGSTKTLIQYYKSSESNSYQWALIEDIHTLSTLHASDFTSDNVTHSSLRVQGTYGTPLLFIYGYENEKLYETMNGHQVFSGYPNNNGFYYDYSYADIFDRKVYSLSAGNYAVQGTGTPPSNLEVPNVSIDYTFSNNRLTFSGLPGYEVGRIRLKNDHKDDHVVVEFIFDGQSTEVILPHLPEGLFKDNITELFNNKGLEIVQGAAEDYSSLDNYSDYLSKVLTKSTPFYQVSPKRQRVFKSSVGPQLLPITEFPYFERF